MHNTVASGLDCLLSDRRDLLRSRRFGLLTNRASVTGDLTPAAAALAHAFPGQLRTLFSPQHGYWSEQQANMVESDHQRHPRLQVSVFSLYADSRRPSPDMLRGLDTLVVDLQDVGTRVYTFVWTMKYCLEACAEAGLPMIVLDRPNPIGGVLVEGPCLEPAFRSFVGEAEIPMRHALTMGELARLFNAECTAPCDLTVVPCRGWDPVRDTSWGNRPWIAPSPNMPTLATAGVYPGQVLLEGVSLSEGRGTTTPFELAGAPELDADALADSLQACEIPGARFLASRFTPAFDKFAGESCGGVALYVTDPTRFHALHSTLCLLACCSRLHATAVTLLPPPYEYETERPPIDIISGGDAVRTWLESGGCDPRQVPRQLWHADAAAWDKRTRPHRLYDRCLLSLDC